MMGWIDMGRKKPTTELPLLNDEQLEMAKKLLEEISKIYRHFEETGINSDLPEMRDELELCVTYLARSAQMRADAEFLLNVARGNFADNYARKLDGQKFNATHFNRLMDGAVSTYQRLGTQADRLNATATHRIDAIRTLISLEKTMRERTHT